MTELQQVEFDLLKEFIRVCEKHSLTYYLIGGSALGAVRHKGFIPGDDDIDVGMPREDYDKLMSLHDEFKHPYFLQNFRTDRKYPLNFAKLRNSETTKIEKWFYLQYKNDGVWIDIFPLDGMERKKVRPAKHYARKVKWNWFNVKACYFWCARRKPQKGRFFKDIGIDILAFIFMFLNIGKYTNKLVDRRAKKIPFSKETLLVGNLFGTNATREAMPYEVFSTPSKGIFEGLKVNLPHDSDKYLTLLYGDYMKLPPENERVMHHEDMGEDIHMSYIEYRKLHKM